jgi:hypothetical protein
MSTDSVGTNDPHERPLVSQFGLQLGAALGTLLFGAVIVFGAIEYDIGWDERGPQPGYFPFWMGLLVIAGSLGTLIQTMLNRRDLTGTALTWAQAGRVAQFVWPILGFLIATSFLGLYVAMILYLFTVMVLHGGYRIPTSLGVSVGSALVFYLLFDKWLKVPLMKGPIEAWLGIY